MQKGRTKNAIANDGGPGDAFDKTTIEKLAYENWVSRGRPEGSAEIDWIEAERILQATSSGSPSAAAQPGKGAKKTGSVMRAAG